MRSGISLLRLPLWGLCAAASFPSAPHNVYMRAKHAGSDADPQLSGIESAASRIVFCGIRVCLPYAAFCEPPAYRDGNSGLEMGSIPIGL
jgi:hypothetical protein